MAAHPRELARLTLFRASRRSGPWVALLGLALCGAQGHAQEGGEGASVAEAENTPRIVTVGFADVDGEDCRPEIARYGRCVEEVQFVDLSHAWRDDDAPPVDADADPEQLRLQREQIRLWRAQWRNTSVAYSEIWDDLAHRWKTNVDPIAIYLRGREVERLPVAKQQWEATDRTGEGRDTAVFSLPRSSTWLSEQRWIDQRVHADPRELTPTQLLTPTEAFFPVMRVHKADGLVPSDPFVILHGRFASRLAYDNRRHPYDLMDGDPETAGPLFEQMYPYARGLASEGEEDESEVPLDYFIVEETLKQPAGDDLVALRVGNFRSSLLLPGDDLYKVYDFANQQFERFYRLIGVQILRFAREEYTPTHIRVLTALMAMESPPNESGEGYLGADALVAASKGQLDEIDDGVGQFRGFASSRGFAINFAELPRELIERHIVTFDEWNNPSADFMRSLLIEVINNLEEHLRPGIRQNRDSYAFRGLDDAAIDLWIQNNSFPGRTQTVQRYFKRIALDLLVSRLDKQERERIESGILLDHMNLTIRRSFGGKDSSALPPVTLEERASEEWVEVLGLHGMYPDAIPDRPGIVNPLAICTTLDRAAAMDEPSFRKVDLDVLVVGPDWYADSPETAADLLWEVREDVPFIMVDDPSKNPPQIDPLMQLPNGRAVYRIRWQVWSGWHLFWAVEPLADKDEDPNAPRRIALRTGAVCDDMVLTAPSLVATLARAALLDGEFRPAVPVREDGKTERPSKKKDNDQAKLDLDETVDDAEASSRAVTTAGAAVAGDGQAQIETARNLIGALRFNPARKKFRNGVDITPVDNEHVLYVRRLMQAPLRGLVGNKPMLLSVIDHATPGARERIWDFKPRTPYFQVQTKFGVAEYLRTAAWALDIERPEVEFESTVMMSPAYLPTELLNTAELKQVWRRRRTSDWNFGGGIGFMPYRFTKYKCNDFTDEELRVWSGTVAQCSDGGLFAPRPSEVSGLSLDLTAIYVQWMAGDRRIAIEFGPEAHLDVLAPGSSPFYDGDRPVTGVTRLDEDGEPIEFGARTDYDWSFRLQGGVLVGLRFAPNPGPLWRSSARKFPWGSPLPDGSSSLGRVEYGLRAGFLMGPSFDGFEGTAFMEAWAGWSVRSPRGRNATLTPYHPATLIGPYVRGAVSAALSPNTSRYLRLDYSLAATVGLRAQFRLTAQPKLDVEAPEL
jgi:hypothetical protein